MVHKYFLYLKFLLRKAMEMMGFVSPERLLINDQRYVYEARTPNEWSYVASLDDFGGDKLILICSYGKTNSKNQYEFRMKFPA